MSTTSNGKTELEPWTVLENAPEVMNPLAHTLGLSPSLTFHEIYSLDEEVLSAIPRPALALSVIFPLTPGWAALRSAEDANRMDEAKDEKDIAEDSIQSPSSPSSLPRSILWFKQTIPHACGTYSLVHSALNGGAAPHIKPDSTLARIRDAAQPLSERERPGVLERSAELAAAHAAAATQGSSRVPPSFAAMDKLGQHFVAFVKAGGRLWELEGCRPGPIDRGPLAEGEDVLSPRALRESVGRVLDVAGGDLRFSALALCESP